MSYRWDDRIPQRANQRDSIKEGQYGRQYEKINIASTCIERCDEALRTTINFDKCVAHINGTKTDNAPRYMDLSQSYCDRIRNKWESMFKHTAHYYSEEIPIFLKLLGIQDKTCHSLRHTFSSNIFYLGVDDMKCQRLMGHGSIMMTRDIYTTYDPTITAKDITDLYGDLYPFAPKERTVA